MNVDQLMSAAREKVDLDDFGDDWFVEPLTVLVGSLDAEANLNELGQQLTERRLVAMLVERLRLRAVQAEHPEVLDEQVRVAAEICGLPRTGSTLLHRLLCASPEVTSTASWEMTYPLPFPGESPAAEIRKDKAAERTRLFMEMMSPDFGDIHTVAWDEPEEDILLLDRSFTSQSFDSYYRVPTYGLWLREFDQAPAYAELKQWFQVLQWQDPSRAGKPWVLKSPHHLTAVDTVLDTFEDCRLVMTHRTPTKAVPSYASMVTTLAAQYSDEVDKAFFGQYWSDRFVTALRQYGEARDRRPDRFIDVQFADTVSDPVAVAEHVLTQLGLPVHHEALEAYVEKNRAQRHGSHAYTPEEFGLSEDGLAEDFAFYASEVA